MTDKQPKTPAQKILNNISKYSYEREAEALPNSVYPSRWKKLDKKEKALQCDLVSFTILAIVDELEDNTPSDWTFTRDELIGDLRLIAHG